MSASSPASQRPGGTAPTRRAQPGLAALCLSPRGTAVPEPRPDRLCPLSTGPCSLSSCPLASSVCRGDPQWQPQSPAARAPELCPCHHAAPALERPLESSLGPMAKGSLHSQPSQRQGEGHRCWQRHWPRWHLPALPQALGLCPARPLPTPPPLLSLESPRAQLQLPHYQHQHQNLHSPCCSCYDRQSATAG